MVSIGNITMGGTGKTPFTIYLARLLSDYGIRCAILSRGYRRRGGGAEPLVLTDGDNLRLTVDMAGDEPFLLAQRLPKIPIVLSRDRGEGGKLIEKLFNPEVIILDDGFQQKKLRKDLDLLLIDGRNPFGNGWLTPAGALREPVSAIRRADGIIITRGEERQLPSVKERIAPFKRKETPIFRGRIKVEGVFPLGEKRGIPLQDIKGLPVIAFSGIGNPASFEETASSLGLRLISHRRFRDHHWYRRSDISSLIAEAEKRGAKALLTTEKDAVKLRETAPSNFPIFYLKIGMEIIDEEEFLFFLLSRLGLRR